MLKVIYDASGNLVNQTEGIISAPQIVGQPVSQEVDPGQITSFSVVVSDANGVTFQWKFNSTSIPGATDDSLLLRDVGAADVGLYSVVVNNSTGSVISAPASLKLI